MEVNDLYLLWLAKGHDELAEHVFRTQAGYDRLIHKDSTYGRSIKAILDLHIQILAVWDAAPQTLTPNVQAGDTFQSEVSKQSTEQISEERIAELMLPAFPKTKCSRAYLAFARAIEREIKGEVK